MQKGEMPIKLSLNYCSLILNRLWQRCLTMTLLVQDMCSLNAKFQKLLVWAMHYSWSLHAVALFLSISSSYQVQYLTHMRMNAEFLMSAAPAIHVDVCFLLLSQQSNSLPAQFSYKTSIKKKNHPEIKTETLDHVINNPKQTVAAYFCAHGYWSWARSSGNCIQKWPATWATGHCLLQLLLCRKCVIPHVSRHANIG